MEFVIALLAFLLGCFSMILCFKNRIRAQRNRLLNNIDNLDPLKGGDTYYKYQSEGSQNYVELQPLATRMESLIRKIKESSGSAAHEQP